ncbi:Calcium permeable stress-gated cation channel 1 [Astathelohania contejeani]|uniref:Calcium permeable stress-gated cation channel 1 n=1 Tax=Astathelohania contejeani TaxID=164912 RepID=A0ABQ7HXK1_9MICR|nr:Calcium permeable stress-gated cation channel 1 [Thelohania contejeani]
MDRFTKGASFEHADHALFINIVTQIITGAIIFIFFILIRPAAKWIYSPNTCNSPSHPAYRYTGHLDWLIPVFTLNDVEILSFIGLDGFIILQIIKLLLRFFLILSCTCLPLLGYVYWNGKNASDVFNQYVLKLSISHLSQGSQMLWVSTSMVYFTTFLLLHLIYIFYKKYTILRKSFISNPETMISIPKIKEKSKEYFNQSSRSVFLTRLPSSLKTNDDLRIYVKEMGIKNVKSCFLLQNTYEMINVMNERDKIIHSIEKEIVIVFKRLNKWCRENKSECIEKINAFVGEDLITSAYVLNEITEKEEQKTLFEYFLYGGNKWKNKRRNGDIILNLKIKKLKNLIKSLQMEEYSNEEIFVDMENSDITNCPFSPNVNFYPFKTLFSICKYIRSFGGEFNAGDNFGFITFYEQKQATLITQCRLENRLNPCSAHIAPLPGDTFWNFIRTPAFILNIRKLVSTFVYYVFFLFFLVAVTAILTLSDVNNITSKFPKLRAFFNEHPKYEDFYYGSCIPFIYSQLLNLAPVIIFHIVTHGGVLTRTQQSDTLMRKYFLFLFFNAFIGNITTSILVPFLENMLYNPMKIELSWMAIYNSLGSVLMRCLTLFYTLNIQRAISGNILDLFMPIRFLLHGVLNVLFPPLTPRKSLEKRKPEKINWAIGFPIIILATPMILFYSVISPLILLVGFIYYLMTYFTVKTKLLFSCENSYTESGGLHWWPTMKMILWSLMAFQIGTSIKICLHENYTAGIVTCITFPITVFFYRILGSLFQNCCQTSSLEVFNECSASPFYKTYLKKKEEMLEKWVMPSDIVDYIDLDIIVPFDAENLSIWEESIVFNGFERIILPKGFFKTMKFIKKNDFLNILNFK